MDTITSAWLSTSFYSIAGRSDQPPHDTADAPAAHDRLAPVQNGLIIQLRLLQRQ